MSSVRQFVRYVDKTRQKVITEVIGEFEKLVLDNFISVHARCHPLIAVDSLKNRWFHCLAKIPQKQNEARD